MSRRNSPEAKAKRRLRKSLRNTPPSKIDLVEYVRLRTGCSYGVAKQVLLEGALMVDSHPVGYKWVKGMRVLDPYIDAKHRDNIIVRMPPERKEST